MSVLGFFSRRSVGRSWRQPAFSAFAGVIACGVSILAQSPNSPEVKTSEVRPSFKIQVERNLVPVRIVVRDLKGRPVGGLQKEDFRIFDNGKPQVISHFTVETPSAKAINKLPPPAERPADTASTPESGPPTAQRFLALFFDDVHMSFEDIARTRDAADRYLASALLPNDRAGLFTSSGQGAVEFTDDRAKLHEALFRLRPRPTAPREAEACPDIYDYQAYQIIHEHDIFAIEIATAEVLDCRYNNDNRYLQQARSEAEFDAVRTLNYAEIEAQHSVRGLEELVRRMTLLPGQRNIVFVSPGFFSETLRASVNEVIDRALRSSVVINTLDSKGLFAPIPLGDATKRSSVLPRRADLVGRKAQINLNGFDKDVEILRDTAFATGGEFFHNNNDLDAGFQQVGSLPETYYVLAFSPKILKYDGHFHSLKVQLVNPAHLTVQARRGYFAPRSAPDAAAREKDDIENALFSQTDLSELPMDIQTQFFRTNDQDTKLAVVTHLDLRFLQFRKDEGRNLNNLTVVTALFDRDGKYLTANEKRLEFRLRDTTLDRLHQSGLTMKTSFNVKPGTYQVRQVVRDSEGGQLSGLSRTVEIPF